MAYGVCTNCQTAQTSSFPPSTGQKWKILQLFFDIVTTHNDEICYVKHVLAPLYVFFIVLTDSSLCSAVHHRRGAISPGGRRRTLRSALSPQPLDLCT